MRDTFVYLRTKLAVEYENDAIKGIARDFPYTYARSIVAPKEHCNDPFLVPVVGFGENVETWANGLVLWFPSFRPPNEVADHLREALSAFDAWAIYNDGNEFIESTPGGLMNRFLSRPETSAVAQIYVVAHEGDHRYDLAVENFRTQLRRRCAPVFHFREGQIMFLSTDEPAGIIARRSLRQLRAFEHWAVIDRLMSTHSSDPHSRDIWVGEDLENLTFGDDNEEEDDEDFEDAADEDKNDDETFEDEADGDTDGMKESR